MQEKRQLSKKKKGRSLPWPDRGEIALKNTGVETAV